jgi:hypothetical protein
MKITYIILLLSATLVASLLYRKRSPLCTNLFIAFITATLGIEVGASILKYTFDASNLWLYNIYMYMAFLFWFWQLSKNTGNQSKVRFWLATFSIVVAAFVENFVASDFLQVNSLVFAVGTLCFVLLFISKIYQAFALKDEIIPSYEMMFLSAGLGFFVIFFFDTLLYPTGLLSKPIWAELNLDQILTRFTNYYFYLMLMLSIVVSAKKV